MYARMSNLGQFKGRATPPQEPLFLLFLCSLHLAFFPSPISFSCLPHPSLSFFLFFPPFLFLFFCLLLALFPFLLLFLSSPSSPSPPFYQCPECHAGISLYYDVTVHFPFSNILCFQIFVSCFCVSPVLVGRAAETASMYLRMRIMVVFLP